MASDDAQEYFSGSFGQVPSSTGNVNVREFSPAPNPRFPQITDKVKALHSQELPPPHGEALARDRWLERYGKWIVLGFIVAFALSLLGMVAAGNVPGQSLLLKVISDVLQFVGECIGLFFCIRITLRLRNVSIQMQRTLRQQEQQGIQPRSRNELITARSEVQAAKRAFFAWGLLSLGIAFYAGGQAGWTYYDVQMHSFLVPFPGLYDIGFVGSYPFFLVGTLFLTHHSRAAIERTRLLLDALAIIGASVALSWFFVLSPTIAGLSHSPNPGAIFLSVYFPAGDLFLVAVGALMMFSPLSTHEQRPVLIRLCLGLFCLAITDSLLGYFSLSPTGFNTGTLQDTLWPLSMSLIGLAAIQYPRSVAREQEKAAHMANPALARSPLFASSTFTQISSTLQTIAPLLLALLTCTILLTVVAPHGGSWLLQRDLIALALILVVVVRQALTMIENNYLILQLRGELVISRRELQVTRREVDEATRAAQEKYILEEGIASLQETSTRVARGDFRARATITSGPLLPIALSFNLMLDRLSTLSQRESEYEQVLRESKMLQAAINCLVRGFPAWTKDQPLPRSSTELAPVFLGLAQIQRVQESQWQHMTKMLETIGTETRRLHKALTAVRKASKVSDSAQSINERTAIEQSMRALEQLEQQLAFLLSQIRKAAARLEQPVVE